MAAFSSTTANLSPFSRIFRFSRYNRDDRKGRAFGLPACGTAAGVVMRDIALDADLHGSIAAMADERAASKGSGSLLYAGVDRRMK